MYDIEEYFIYSSIMKAMSAIENLKSKDVLTDEETETIQRIESCIRQLEVCLYPIIKDKVTVI